MKTVKVVCLDISGWEVEVPIPFSFTYDPGEPVTWDHPGCPEEICDIEFEDDIVKAVIRSEVRQIEAAEDTRIKLDMPIVLDDLTEYLETNGKLHEDLMNAAIERINNNY